MTVAGTTDSHSEVTFNPKPRNSDIEFILSEIRGYLNKNITGKSQALGSINYHNHSSID
jgi:glycerol-3-phosphate dehydrogenase